MSTDLHAAPAAAADLRSVPRAPGRIPLLGHAWPLWRRPLDFLRALPDTGDLVRVDLGTMPVYFATSPSLVHELLVVRAREFDKGRFFDRARVLVGDGLFTAGEEVHRRHRRLMQPMFHRDRIAAYVDTMSVRARALADSWQPGETVSLTEAIYTYAVGTLSETMFSTNIDKATSDAIHREVPILIKYALVRAVAPTAFDRIPVKANREFDRATERVLRIIDGLIADAHARGPAEGGDLLSTLLAARDADTGESLTDREVRDESVAIMFAGTETAATALSWLFHEIGRAPEVEERLFAEIDAVVGDRPVGMAELAKLPYLNQVMDEVFRLHAVPLLMRRAIRDVEFAGFRLPAGTEIGFSLYAMHQDGRVHDDPLRFDPDRWSPENRATRPRETHIPFGAGVRKCIGDTYARTEIAVAVATILSRWRLRPAPGVTVREVAAAVAHPDRLPMIVEPRTR